MIRRLVEALLLATLFVLTSAVPEPSAHAAYNPPAPWVLQAGTTLPTTGLLVKTGGGVFGGFNGYVAATTNFLQAFDATSQPATGAAPIWSSASCASGVVCVVTTPPGGIRFTTGLYLAWSTTGTGYTQQVSNVGQYGIAYR